MKTQKAADFLDATPVEADEERTGINAITSLTAQVARLTENNLRSIRQTIWQMNMLALNAKIEAARAGRAGPGAGFPWWPTRFTRWATKSTVSPKGLKPTWPSGSNNCNRWPKA